MSGSTAPAELSFEQPRFLHGKLSIEKVCSIKTTNAVVQVVITNYRKDDGTIVRVPFCKLSRYDKWKLLLPIFTKKGTSVQMNLFDYVKTPGVSALEVSSALNEKLDLDFQAHTSEKKEASFSVSRAYVHILNQGFGIWAGKIKRLVLQTKTPEHVIGMTYLRRLAQEIPDFNQMLSSELPIAERTAFPHLVSRNHLHALPLHAIVNSSDVISLLPNAVAPFTYATKDGQGIVKIKHTTEGFCIKSNGHAKVTLADGKVATPMKDVWRKLTHGMKIHVNGCEYEFREK